MRTIALTGGIASGKSTAVDYLRELGAKVFDSDACSREITKAGEPGAMAIREAFGAGFFDEKGNLDRRALGEMVFSDAGKRRRLEGLLHPIIMARMARWMEEMRGDGEAAVVLDIPLLYEVGWQDRFDEVWLVYVPREVQRMRLMVRDGLSEAQAEARIRSQMDPEGKRARADVLIDASGAIEDTQAQLLREWTRMMSGVSA